jgi:hypothetical protein
VTDDTKTMSVLVQRGWYWVRGEAPDAAWNPAWIHDDHEGRWYVGGAPVDSYPGEIGPMLTEQGPSKPVMRVEISVPQMETMIREMMSSTLVLPSEDPHMDLLLEVWNDGYSKGADLDYPAASLDGRPRGAAELDELLAEREGRLASSSRA